MSRRKKQVMDEIKRESLAEMMLRTNQPSEFDNETTEGSGSRKHRTTPDPKPPAAARDGVADAPPVSGAADARPGAPAALLSTAVNDTTHVYVVTAASGSVASAAQAASHVVEVTAASGSVAPAAPAASHVDEVHVTNLQCPPLLHHVRMPWSRFFVFSGHTAGAYHHGRRCCFGQCCPRSLASYCGERSNPCCRGHCCFGLCCPRGAGCIPC